MKVILNLQTHNCSIEKALGTNIAQMLIVDSLYTVCLHRSTTLLILHCIPVQRTFPIYTVVQYLLYCIQDH